MRKLAIATIAAVVIGLAGAGATFAGKDHRDGGRTFSVFATTTPDRLALLPVVPGKFSLGDRIILSDDLLTSRGGNRVGTDAGECTLVRITDAATQSGLVECLVMFSLPGGQIATQALNTLTNGAFTAGAQTGAITGGTGKYRDAEGEFSVEVLSETEANITFFLND
jgi:hypothetical protein